jgi:parallel beta-helix repeat protein/predicted outer membrane repeat protein
MKDTVPANLVFILFSLASLAPATTHLTPDEYATIQAAIDDCNDGDVVIVAPGTYTGDGNRDISFKGKAITVQSIDPDDPNIVSATIMDCNGTEDNPHRGFIFHSGEGSNSMLDGLTIMNGYADGGGGVYCLESSPKIRNCIISANNVDAIHGSNGGGIYCYNSDLIINACYIIDNTAYAWPAIVIVNGYGGGIYCSGGSPNIRDCTFTDNEAGQGGGGICCCNESNPVISKCTFSDNRINEIAFLSDSAPTLIDCDFDGNAEWISSDSAIRTQDTNLMINNCRIRNYFGLHGGGVRCQGGSLLMSDCDISGNRAYFHGGGLFCSGLSTISNCTITGNAASNCWYGGGGGIYCNGGFHKITSCTISSNNASRCRGGGICCEDASIEVSNCVLYENRARGGSHQIGILNYSKSTVSHSDVENGLVGIYVSSPSSLNWYAGNIDAGPCFIKPGYWGYVNDPNTLRGPFEPNAVWIDGDYHLKSQAAQWDPVSESWVKDDFTSPCIDAGDPRSPIGQEPFPNGGIVNMGAYGGTAEASKSYFGEPVCETAVAGDINGDCKVDFADFQIMARHWLQDYGP